MDVREAKFNNKSNRKKPQQHQQQMEYMWGEKKSENTAR